MTRPDFVPAIPQNAHIVFDVQGYSRYDIESGLQAAHKVFTDSGLPPNESYMSLIEVQTVWLDVWEGDSMAMAEGIEPEDNPVWERLCVQADLWDFAREAALRAACANYPNETLAYKFYLDWKGREHDALTTRWEHVDPHSKFQFPRQRYSQTANVLDSDGSPGDMYAKV